MRWSISFLCIFLASSLNTIAGEVRVWTDKSGRHQIEAELISVSGGYASLRKTDGVTIRVLVERLSDADQLHLKDVSQAPNGDDTAKDSGTTNSGITFRDLEKLSQTQREAAFVVNLFEGFLKTPGVAAAEKKQVTQELPKWRELAAKQAVRVGNKWLAPDEVRRAKEDELRLIKEAHRLIDIKNDELAREKFLEASKVNPEGVRADFYLGLLNALVVLHPGHADVHFTECVRRLARDDDLLTGTRRANYVAALNNLAIINVRKREYGKAISNWRKALEIAPFTPELVQNLGLTSALAQRASFVRIPKEQRNSAGTLYAKSTVENSLARFDETVGWLFIPYVDTVDGSMDSTGDEELVTIGWCTGFSIGGEYVLTSRYPFEDADRVLAKEGGNTFEAPAGKVVAVADDSHLAVIRIDGLKGKKLSLSLQEPRPAQDVTIVGYGSPGLVNNTLQKRTATILAPPRFYENVDVVVRQRVGPDVDVFVHSRGVRQLLMHDAITNPAMEGAPLLDKTGVVVGVHLGNRPEFGKFGSKHSWAESGGYLLERISSVIEDDLQVLTSENRTPVDDAGLDALINGSIFQLAIQKRAPRLSWSHRIEQLHQLQRQGDWASYEDTTCMACNGKLQLNCTNRGCARGSVRRRERELKYTDPNTGNQVWGSRIVVEQCNVCSGRGYVSCPNCNGTGKDRTLP